MADSDIKGRCGCGELQYRVTAKPMYVQCCHCSECQHQTGAPFVVNALLETSAVELLSGETETTLFDTGSGAGHEVIRCASCKTPVWSYYLALGRNIAFLRVGTLDDSSVFPPDIHVFTRSKLDWTLIPTDAAAVEEFYRFKELWPEESMARFKAAMSAA